MTIETLGIDIAKTVFQLHGVNRNGRLILKRRVMRDQLLQVIVQIEPCTIAIEACTGAFFWQRKFEELGHKVKIISPQYVKPFVRRQKTDGNDAEAICTAARQAHMRFVPKKSIEQQDIQALHRARQRMVNHRTAVVSQIRGLLLDRGIAFPKSINRARRMIPERGDGAGAEERRSWARAVAGVAGRGGGGGGGQHLLGRSDRADVKFGQVRRCLARDSLGTMPSRLRVGCMRGISVVALLGSEKGT